MSAIVVIGIDLAGSPRRETGMCRLSGLRARTAILHSDDEILDFVRAGKPHLVAIDAPLTLPPGRKSIDDRNGEHYRPCDMELRRRKIPFFPITLGPMRTLTVRGIELKKRIRRSGVPVIEIYPGGALDVWGLPRQQHDRGALRRGLTRLGVRDLGRGASGHELDAATGALVGRLHLQGRSEPYGSARTGVIVMPREKGRRT